MPTTKKKAAKKTGKYKSAMSGKFIKPDAAKDNPYSTYKLKEKKKDALREDIRAIATDKSISPNIRLLRILMRLKRK
jgi:hypothetical protein